VTAYTTTYQCIGNTFNGIYHNAVNAGIIYVSINSTVSTATLEFASNTVTTVEDVMSNDETINSKYFPYGGVIWAEGLAVFNATSNVITGAYLY
jgi:hypothetical protein